MILERKKKIKKLFERLYIESSSIMNEQRKYPVIFISMKDIKGDSFEALNTKLRTELSNLLIEFEVKIWRV